MKKIKVETITGRQFGALILVILGVALALYDVDGWGWLLFLAICVYED